MQLRTCSLFVGCPHAESLFHVVPDLERNYKLPGGASAQQNLQLGDLPTWAEPEPRAATTSHTNGAFRYETLKLEVLRFAPHYPAFAGISCSR